MARSRYYTDTMKPTFGSLFSGIGGIDLGLEQAGWECRWQVEKDRFCTSVLKKHWPKVPKFGDVKLIAGSELEPVELICGGFPCQPISIAGKRKAQEDERWLWPEFERIISILRPSYILVENVPNLTNLGLDEVLGSLASLRYDAEWDCIPAASLGAPHLRFRIFVVAYDTDTDGRSWQDKSKSALQSGPSAHSGRARDVGNFEDKGKHVALSDADGRNLRIWGNGQGKQYQHERSTIALDNGIKEQLAQTRNEMANSNSDGQSKPSSSYQDERLGTRPGLSSKQPSNVAYTNIRGRKRRRLHLRSGKQEEDSAITEWFGEIISNPSRQREGSGNDRRILGLANDG